MCNALVLLALLPAAAPPGAVPPDLEALQGKWVLVAESLGGPVRPPRGPYGVVFEGGRYSVLAGREVTARWDFTLDTAASPRRMDGSAGEKTLAQIYRLEGARSRSPSATPGTNHTVWRYGLGSSSPSSSASPSPPARGPCPSWWTSTARPPTTRSGAGRTAPRPS